MSSGKKLKTRKKTSQKGRESETKDDKERKDAKELTTVTTEDEDKGTSEDDLLDAEKRKRSGKRKRIEKTKNTELRSTGREDKETAKQAEKRTKVDESKHIGRANKNQKIEPVIQKFKESLIISGLIKKIEKEGIKIKETDQDDTRYDRQKKTIYVYKKKKEDELKAALLFELNNADNPHKYTDAVEEVLLDMSKKDETLTGMDYIHVAKEMEKDEFVSLVNYHHQVKDLYKNQKIPKKLAEKYDEMEEEGGKLSYAKYVDQNRKSGHTSDLAEAQHDNFMRGKGSKFEDLSLPVEYLHPGSYTLNGGKLEAMGTLRTNQKLQAQLDKQDMKVNQKLLNSVPDFKPEDIKPDDYMDYR